MSEIFRLNPLRGALIFGAFSSALAAPTSMSALHYARDLSNQLDPVNAPVPGPDLAGCTTGLDLMAAVQARELHSNSACNNEACNQVDDSDESHICFPDVRQVSDDHTQLRKRMDRSAAEWTTLADDIRAEIAELQRAYEYKYAEWANLNRKTGRTGLRTERVQRRLERQEHAAKVAADNLHAEITRKTRTAEEYERRAAERAEQEAAANILTSWGH
ncbi:hypothetical protein EV360DRAFT_87553 [Lentinula raphanica]|nr:hypothetical protein EV360DRAFT_87553 [Lentinula raphanica]